MGKTKQMYKKVLLGIIMGVLFLPIIQEELEVFEKLKLDGYFEEATPPEFSIEKWFNQEYQDGKQAFIDENFGFRNFLVKLNNQICFSLFRYSRTKNVVIGKSNFLFDARSIKSVYGTDFIGEELIKKRTTRLQVVKDSLKKRNIDLLVVIAPGKGYYFPEHIPNKFKPDKTSKTNYEVYVSEFLEKQIPFIDFNKFFIQQKNKSDYPLFSEGGVHWSNYGELLAGDSIIRRIEKTRNEELPHMKINEIIVSDSAQKTDNDIEKGMNLLMNLNKKKLGYPTFEFVRNEKTKKVRVLTIADSFYWGLYNQGFSASVFDEGQFWYYNRERYQPGKEKLKGTALINVKEEIEKHQVVMLLFNESNLAKFSYGFIDKAYEYYVNGYKLALEKRIEKLVETMKASPEWFANIKRNAKKNGITIEEELKNNAEYMISMEDLKKQE